MTIYDWFDQNTEQSNLFTYESIENNTNQTTMESKKVIFNSKKKAISSLGKLKNPESSSVLDSASRFSDFRNLHSQQFILWQGKNNRLDEQVLTDALDKNIILMKMEYLSGSSIPIITNKWTNPESTFASTEKNEEDLISSDLLQLFLCAREEIFEDGIESEFSKKLVQMIKEDQQRIINALEKLIPSGMVNIEVGSEALRWIGRMDDPKTYFIRRHLLETSLFSQYARIRDGAALGLSSMNDSHSKKFMQLAIERETIDELRSDLQQILYEFEE